MEKKELKRLIEDVVNKIKSNSKDERSADELIEKLLSLKGQYDVEPTRVCVEDKDVIKEYDFGSYRIIRCKSCIVYQEKGGFTSVVSPRMTGLYTHLREVLDMKERFKELSDDEKNVYDAIESSTAWIMSVPVFATCSDELFFGIASDVIGRFSEFVDSSMGEPLKDEEADKDADFENRKDAMRIIGRKDAGDK